MLRHLILFALIFALAMAQTVYRAWSYYSIQLSESTINYVRLVTTVDYGTPFYYANLDSYPTLQKNIWKYENYTGGSIDKYIYNPNVDLRTGNYANRVLYLAIYGYTKTQYSLTAYTQGPITLYDRQVLAPTFPIANGYLFYNFTIDSDLRLFQAVIQPAIGNVYNFYISNSTAAYPVDGQYQYKSTNNGSNWCVRISYPYPGSYRLGLSTFESSKYVIQIVENGPGTCKVE